VYNQVLKDLNFFEISKDQKIVQICKEDEDGIFTLQQARWLPLAQQQVPKINISIMEKRKMIVMRFRLTKTSKRFQQITK